MSKYKRLLFLIFALILVIPLLSISYDDSLRIEINKNQGVKQLELMAELATYLSSENPNDAIAYCDSIIPLAEKDKRLKANILMAKAEANYSLGNIDEAYQGYSHVIKNYNDYASLEDLAYAYYSMALIEEVRLNNDKALEFYNIAKEYYKNIDKELIIADLENNIGLLYEAKSIWDKALEHYVQAYIIYDKFKDKEGVASTYNNMGNIYHTLMNYEKALEFYEKSLEFYKEIGDRDGISVAYNNIGIIYDDKKNFNKALEYYEKSMQIDKENNNIGGVATAYNNLGVIYFRLDDYEKAENYYLKSLAISDSLNDLWASTNTRINLAEVYTGKKYFDQAVDNLEEALEMSEKYGFIDLVMDACLKYSAYYLARDDYENAFRSIEQYNSLKDSLFTNFSLKIAEIQTMFETEEKNREIQLLIMKQNHSSILKTILIIASSILFVLVIWLFYLYLMKNKEVKIRKNLQKEQLRLDSIVSQAQESIVMTDLEGSIVYVNKYFEDLSGYDADEVIGKNANFFKSGLTPKSNYDNLWDTILKGDNWNGTFVNKRKDGSIYYEAATIFPIKDEKGKIINLASVKRDITDQIEAAENLKESEQRFRLMAESINDGLAIIENDKIVYVNERLSEITGYTREELLSITSLKLAAPFEIDRIKKIIDIGKKENHFPRYLEYWAKRKNGNLVYLHNDYSVKENQQVKNLYVITSDMTEKKIAEEKMLTSLHEKEVMLKEIHHRVKNNMQVISSLLKLQSGYVKDNEAMELFKNSQNRVKSMALVHEKLYRSTDLTQIDMGDYIKNLIHHLKVSYSSFPNKIDFIFDIGEVYLDVNSAVPCGLILNELISNAMKYAFSENEKGVIKIGFNKISENKYLFSVTDNGIGLPDDFDINNCNTLGMQLVHSLVMQLHGNIELDNSDGAGFTIYFEKKEKRKKDQILYPESLRDMISD